MAPAGTTDSARRTELLEAAYAYVLDHGLADLSLRPLAAAIGSSPRVLLFLFGSKHGLVAEILVRARHSELELLAGLPAGADLPTAAQATWSWLEDPAHAGLLRLWVELYARSLTDPSGPWGSFAATSVTDWLEVFRRHQPGRDSRSALIARTAALAVLRGGILDLVATGDRSRVGAAVQAQLDGAP